MLKNTIYVDLKKRSYYIYIGKNFLKTREIKNLFSINTKHILIMDQVVQKLLSKEFFSDFPIFKKKTNVIVLKEGENYKNLHTVEKIISILLKKKCNRDTTLIALGGGVIGDITGFVASIYQRGISFIQIPTTLLAQVDSSIGGKTGVNHILGKNMIGSFWQPLGVFINLEFLKYLPKKQILSGISEIIKYSIIFDKKFFIWLEKNIFSLLNLEEKALQYCIYKCCCFKTKIIESDEMENSQRALLNLGHSFAHVIETFMGYGSWLHGYAVSAGIIYSAYVSYILNFLSKDILFRIISIFKKIKLPLRGPNNLNALKYVELLKYDKKNSHGNICLILPHNLENVKIHKSIDSKIIIQAIEKSHKNNF
ncbi:3-dehydroquinate synthase [Buchnera aphidicola]|uniref:3-dehydroquinate synthase n=1 Tax=Buchnera aphidicola subsp. Tuberolachnus salignus TaxID=98804 RepID=A0A161K2H0_BUCTT|nr:3-dehydroquinate synthase [Buchnera aphidicola]CUR53333.1 3-dehydroquinate synthase [Buchnera aphidicola (Tuberolachnus salignus)]